VLNSGSLFWLIVLYPVGFALYKLLMKTVKKLKDSKIEKKLTAFFVYSFIIRLLITAYIRLLFSALIQIKTYYEIGVNWREVFSISGENVGFLAACTTLVSSFNLRLDF